MNVEGGGGAELLTPRLFVYQVFQEGIDEHIKEHHYWLFVMGIQPWPVDFRHKGQWCGKRFHGHVIMDYNVINLTLPGIHKYPYTYNNIWGFHSEVCVTNIPYALNKIPKVIGWWYMDVSGLIHKIANQLKKNP